MWTNNASAKGSSSSQVPNRKLDITDLVCDVSGRLCGKVLVLFCTASSQAPHFLCYSSKAACEMNAAVTAHCPGKARRIQLPLLAVSAAICIHQLERLAYQQWNKTKESTLRIWGIKIHWTSEMNFNCRVKFADVLVWGGLFQLQQNRLVPVFILQRPLFEGQRERRAVRSYLHSEKGNRHNVRRSLHHTEPSKCILWNCGSVWLYHLGSWSNTLCNYPY